MVNMYLINLGGVNTSVSLIIWQFGVRVRFGTFLGACYVNAVSALWILLCFP